MDDDERLRRAAGKVLAAEGYHVVSAATGQEAMEALKQNRFALVISDLRLPDLDGIALLKQTRELLPDVEVVMITGHGSVEKAVEAMRLGAYDFIQKPLDSDALLKTVAKALEKQRLTSENRQLRHQLQQRRGVDALIGDSPAMQAVKQLIRQIAPTDVNVLIQGESGTGKEIVADALHDLSGRRDRPFVKISCAAIPETLLESELFGHERGAFTGAAAARPGKFELADGGTLLLDEIAEMSPAIAGQAAPRVAGRNFSAARRHEGNSRQRASALRHPRGHSQGHRGGKIPARFVLPDQHGANCFAAVARAARGHSAAGGTFSPRRLPARWVRKFAASRPARWINCWRISWPGNVRELNHVLQRAVALAERDTIQQLHVCARGIRRGEDRAVAERIERFHSHRHDGGRSHETAGAGDHRALRGQQTQGRADARHSAAHDVSAFLKPGRIEACGQIGSGNAAILA